MERAVPPDRGERGQDVPEPRQLDIEGAPDRPGALPERDQFGHRRALLQVPELDLGALAHHIPGHGAPARGGPRLVPRGVRVVPVPDARAVGT